MILLVTFIFVIGGEYYLKQTAPIFTSSGRILVHQTSKPASSDETFLYRQGELIKSFDVLGNVVRRDSAALRTLAGSRPPVEYLWEKLLVDVDQKSSVISLRLDAAQSQAATAVLNEVIESFKARQTVDEVGGNEAIVANIKNEMADAEAQLKAVKEQIQAFKRANEAISLRGDVDESSVNQLAERQKALAEAERATGQAQARLEVAKEAFTTQRGIEQYVKLRQGGELHQAPVDREYAKVVADLDRYREILEDPHQRKKDTHPDMVDARVRVAALREKLAVILKEFAEAQMAMLERELETAKREEAKAAEAVAKQKSVAVEKSVNSADYSDLIARRQRIEKQRDALAEQLGSISLVARAPAVRIEVTEPPHASAKPIWPVPTPIRASVLGAGILLGMLMALAFDAVCLRERDKPTASGANPHVLGALPHIIDRTAATTGAASRARAVQLDPASESAVAYRALAAEMLAQVPRNRPRTILITSPTQGDGKSTVASNLALILAQSPHRVLLVDANFQNPSLHTIYPIASPEAGFATALVDPSLLDRAIQATDVMNLELLPMGQPSSPHADAFSGRRVEVLLNSVASRYDFVLIDGPGVLTGAYAAELARACGSALLVLRAQTSSRRMAEHAWSFLRDEGANTLGLVANDITNEITYAART